MILHKLRFIWKRAGSFTKVDNRLLDDARLSWQSKGILCYLLSKHNGWEVHVRDIIKHGADGETVVRHSLRELREHHYARLENIREGGRIRERRLTIDETRRLPPDALLRQRENLKVETLKCEKPHLNKTESNKTNKKYIYGGSRFRVPSLKEVTEHGNTLGLSAEDCEHFFNHHEARGWWLARGVKMKDWRAALRTWKRNIPAFARFAREVAGAWRKVRPVAESVELTRPKYSQLQETREQTDEEFKKARDIARTEMEKFKSKIRKTN